MGLSSTLSSRSRPLVLLDRQRVTTERSGGTGRYADELALISSEAFDMTVVNTSTSDGAASGSTRRSRISRAAQELIRVLPLVVARKIVVVHALTTYRVSPLVRLLAKLPNVTLAATLHDLQDQILQKHFSTEEREDRRRAHEFYATRAVRLIAISDFTRVAAQRMLDVRCPIDVVHHGSEPTLGACAGHHDQLSEAATGPHSGSYFVYPAKAWPHKNHAALIEAVGLAASEFRSYNASLVLTGGFDPDQRHALDGLIRRHGVGDLVDLRGFVESADLQRLLRDAHFLVFPSTYEGFGLPVVEAMYVGCPVLASNIDPLVEVCGSAAAYFDASKPTSIAATMVASLDGTLDRSALVAEAVDRARSFSWDRSRAEHESFFRSAIEASG